MTFLNKIKTRLLGVNHLGKLSIKNITLLKNQSPEVSEVKIIFSENKRPFEIDFSQGDNSLFKKKDNIISKRIEERDYIINHTIYSCLLENIILSTEYATFCSKKTGKYYSESSLWLKSFVLPSSISLKNVLFRKTISNPSFFFFNSNNYYHWFQECLSRLIILNEQSNISYYTNAELNKWQIETLKIFNIDYSKIIVLPENEKLVNFNKFVFVNFPGSTPELIHNELLEKINVFLLNKFKDQNDTKYSKIYISRKKANHRKIINELELETLLVEKYGYKAVCMEDFSVMEQYRIFNSAEYIISVHGPSLTNLIAAKNPIVIELLNENHIVECYTLLAANLGFQYYAIALANFGNPNGKLNGKDFFGYNDMILNSTKLFELLDNIHSKN